MAWQLRQSKGDWRGSGPRLPRSIAEAIDGNLLNDEPKARRQDDLDGGDAIGDCHAHEFQRRMRLAGAGVVPCIRAFRGLAAQDFVNLYLQAGIKFFQDECQQALIMPAPTKRTSGWSMDGMVIMAFVLPFT